MGGVQSYIRTAHCCARQGAPADHLPRRHSVVRDPRRFEARRRIVVLVTACPLWCIREASEKVEGLRRLKGRGTELLHRPHPSLLAEFASTGPPSRPSTLVALRRDSLRAWYLARPLRRLAVIGLGLPSRSSLVLHVSEGWLGGRDSNPDNGVQSAVSYR